MAMLWRVSDWSFLTNHARVLVCIASDPGVRVRDIAQRASITERAAHRIVDELIEAGYLEKHRLGARNYYEVHPEVPLRRELEAGVPIGEVIGPILRRLRAGEQLDPPPPDAAPQALRA
jgi:DNA-binding IclR family transcriptional regulator